jgi:hypothetical protein
VTDQKLPFHVSIRVAVEPNPWKPTATQNLVPAHETPLRKLKLPSGFGLGTTDHSVPLHDSVSVRETVPSLYSPTATQ